MFKKNITKKNKNNENGGKTGARPKLVCGFTLVETLVAISVLMISVTGPLYHASESLKAATYAKEQITAFYLAQDAFEQIVKIRDDNVYSNSDPKPDWNTGLTGCEDINSSCIINIDGTFLNKDIPTDPTNGYYLYLSANNVYSHNSAGGTKTIYERGVTIIPTGGDWTTATEMKVTVKIRWNSRGTVRNFEAYEFLQAINT